MSTLLDYRDIARAQLTIDEGYRKKPYKDSVGKTTIGIGRDLDDVGLSDAEILLMFGNDLMQAEIAAKSVCQQFNGLPDARKAVLLNMAFNMGQVRLSGFKMMLAAIAAGQFDVAADEMANSTWAKQVGPRAIRLEKMMREGVT